MIKEKQGIFKRLMTRSKRVEREFYLSADFGFEVTSPIPQNQPKNNNTTTVIPAVPGTTVMLFPNKRYEMVEFIFYIDDEKGNPCGVKCRIKDYPEIFETFGLPESPVQELELYLDKQLFFDSSSYENGKRTYRYRRYLLQDGKNISG